MTSIPSVAPTPAIADNNNNSAPLARALTAAAAEGGCGSVGRLGVGGAGVVRAPVFSNKEAGGYRQASLEATAPRPACLRGRCCAGEAGCCLAGLVDPDAQALKFRVQLVVP